jgi:hypothetical protein
MSAILDAITEALTTPWRAALIVLGFAALLSGLLASYGAQLPRP